MSDNAFLSTLPAWGATPPVRGALRWQQISIHAPRVGSDQGRAEPLLRLRYFYPRSPRGERRRHTRGGSNSVCISIHAPRVGSDTLSLSIAFFAFSFLSTLPAWGATGVYPRRRQADFGISIHAPRVGSDRSNCLGRY